MNPHTSAGTSSLSSLSSKTFILLLVLVTIAFIWILLPFYGAVFWGSVLAILFAPLNRYFLMKMKRRRTLAALATLSVILVIVIIPLALADLGPGQRSHERRWPRCSRARWTSPATSGR